MSEQNKATLFEEGRGQRRKCPRCDGSGDCPVCGGSGKLNFRDCPQCGGSGECHSCGGTGEIE